VTPIAGRHHQNNHGGDRRQRPNSISKITSNVLKKTQNQRDRAFFSSLLE